MAEPSRPPLEFPIAGLNHRSATAALRDLAAEAAVDGEGELVAIERGLNRLFGLKPAPATMAAETSPGPTENDS